LDVTLNVNQTLTSVSISVEELWNHRYGNLNYNDLMLQIKTLVEGIPIMKNDHFECEACTLGKQHSEEFPIHTGKRLIEILELIDTNVCGPMQTRSLGGSSYILIFL